MALHDVGMANSHLILEATALGLHGHFMGGFDAGKPRATFGLRDSLQPMVFVALGYLGRAEQLEEPFLSREQAPASAGHRPILLSPKPYRPDCSSRINRVHQLKPEKPTHTYN